MESSSANPSTASIRASFIGPGFFPAGARLRAKEKSPGRDSAWLP
jgi:hypothetical protein